MAKRKRKPAGAETDNTPCQYRDGEVMITFVPVDVPRMPPPAGAHRNRAVTIRHCPVEPHHVGQVCGDGQSVLLTPAQAADLPVA